MYEFERIAGIDEVGRGPLAGAVVAAAVVLDPICSIEGLQDSKRLSDKRRRLLDVEIRNRALDFSIGRAEVSEIDDLNIFQATMLAMQRAFLGLTSSVEFALVDRRVRSSRPRQR